jgi:hypothetical protein
MPSYNIHLAVAKRFMELHKGQIKNVRDFYSGNIAPDITNDKSESHFSGGSINTENLLANVKNKVILEKVFLHKYETDFDKGRLLHLLTDYEFYNHFFTPQDIGDRTYKIFSRDLYGSYNYVNPWIEKKYNISYDDTVYADRMRGNIARLENSYPEILSDAVNILNRDRLRRFIEFMAKIDLEDIEKYHKMPIFKP